MLKMIVNAVSAKSGGAATYIGNLAQELATSNHAHQYLFYVPSKWGKLFQGFGDNISADATDMGYQSLWKRFIWDQWILRSVIKRERGDALLSSSDFGMIAPPCKQILIIRNPLFFSSIYLKEILPRKSWRFKREFSLRRRLIALSTKASDRVITASRSMLDDVRRLVQIPDGKAVVNYFGVPLERFNGGSKGAESEGEKRLDEAGKLRLLYVSEYSDYKNLTTLLRAVLILRERGIDDFYLISTADPTQFPDVEVITRDEDKRLSSHPLVAPVVKFTGSVPYEDIPKLYGQSDIFVFPSLAESFGHPLVEAMASGLPIIASDIPICREICADAAIYFDPLNPHDLAQKILMLRSNLEFRIRLGQAGTKRAKIHFDFRDHVRRLVGLIEQVTGKT